MLDGVQTRSIGNYGSSSHEKAATAMKWRQVEDLVVVLKYRVTTENQARQQYDRHKGSKRTQISKNISRPELENPQENLY